MQTLLQARVAEVEPGAGVAAGGTGRQLDLPVAAPRVAHALHVHAPVTGMPMCICGACNNFCLTQSLHHSSSHMQPLRATVERARAVTSVVRVLLLAIRQQAPRAPTKACLARLCQGLKAPRTSCGWGPRSRRGPPRAASRRRGAGAMRAHQTLPGQALPGLHSPAHQLRMGSA